MVELVPFFVHSTYKTKLMQIALCRVVHYLRVQPAWTAGNTILPFPQHIGETLLNDYLCVLGIDK